MATVLQLERMSTQEKLRALEEIWADLSRNTASVPVPDWHRDVLIEREKRIEAGGAAFHEWSEVKRRLRDRAS